MNILLVCNAGMSTSMMAKKLTEEAAKRGIDADVKAAPLSEIKDHTGDVSAILLGPQVRFVLNDLKGQYPDIPVMAIAPQDFGMMNAKKVMDDVLAAQKQA